MFWIPPRICPPPAAPNAETGYLISFRVKRRGPVAPPSRPVEADDYDELFARLEAIVHAFAPAPDRATIK